MDGKEDMKHCSNCKRDIATANFLMHEVHCRRNIVLCPTCKEPVPRSELSDHEQNEHVPVSCEMCSASVQKADIEEHKRDVCPKRRVACMYCELECSYCDLQEHLDFCGTRTEPCIKCGQYIMHKDLTRHEGSNCQYPAPQLAKPAANQSSDTYRPYPSRSQRSAHILPDEQFNPFLMDELGRILNFQEPLPGSSGYTAPQRRKKAPSNSDRSQMNTQARLPPRRTVPKTTNVPSGRLVQSPGASENMDHLLAMHLAEDLGGTDDGIMEHLRDRELEQVAAVQDTDPQAQWEMCDMSLLPCEYCYETFPVDIIYQHQSCCERNPSTDVSSHQGNQDPSQDLAQPALNNTTFTSRPAADAPAYVDNLSDDTMQDWIGDEPFGGVEDNIVLPCEFCDLPFPEFLLIQHQSVCEYNVSQTPRVQSPLVHTTKGRTYRPKPPTTHGDLRDTPSSINRQLRRQQDPLVSHRGMDSVDVTGASGHDRENYGVTAANRKPKKCYENFKATLNTDNSRGRIKPVAGATSKPVNISDMDVDRDPNRNGQLDKSEKSVQNHRLQVKARNGSVSDGIVGMRPKRMPGEASMSRHGTPTTYEPSFAAGTRKGGRPKNRSVVPRSHNPDFEAKGSPGLPVDPVAGSNTGSQGNRSKTSTKTQVAGKAAPRRKPQGDV